MRNKTESALPSMVMLKVGTAIMIANNKDRAPKQPTTTACWLRAEDRPSTQIAKVFCGKAFVSVHIRPVSTPSLRSVGHSPYVHGTQAQIKLATSTCLNVVRNGYAQDKKAKGRKAVYAERQRPASCRAKFGNNPMDNNKAMCAFATP